MQLLFKAALGGCIIALCTYLGRKAPSLSGLIAVMPLTGLLVLFWIYYDKQGGYEKMVPYCKGAVLGIIPSVLFFLVALLCFRKGLSLWVCISAGFAVWIAGAFIHQWLLR